MKVVRGQITCEETSSIPDGAVVTIRAVDNSIGCGPTVELGKTEIKSPKSFPLNYELQVDESKVNVSLAMGYHLDVQVMLNGAQAFVVWGSIYLIEDGKINDTFNVAVHPVS